MSRWFNALTLDDQQMVAECVRNATAVLMTQVIEPAGKLDILVKPAHVIVSALG